MAGYSDVPFRLICREMGSVASYTPCMQEGAMLRRSRRRDERTDFREEERPVAMQLLGKDENLLVEAALRAQDLGADLIDLNFGCPARRVSWHGRGAALLREPLHIGHLVSRVVRAVSVPVTAKIRLGWDQASRNHCEVARILEDSGIAAITVHGRTKEQGYSGQADWDSIAEVRAQAKVPVIANGDVRTVADIDAIKMVTGCTMVMIGRGAVGHPWIFARRDVADISYTERQAMIHRHLGDMVAYYGERVALLVFRKHVVHYVRAMDDATTRRNALVACRTTDELFALLGSWAG
jgi:tRNA-dihydrouridine synthase B